ncbi:MAG: hypothetical protein ACE5HS_07255 [bacterium]
MRMQLTTIFLILLSAESGFLQTLDSTATAAASTEGMIKAEVKVEPKEVPQNRNVTYTVVVSWQGDLERYEIENIESPVLSNLEVVSNATANWVGEISGVQQVRKTYEFVLKPVAIGMAYIDGVMVDYRDQILDKSSRLFTNRLEIKVIEPIIEKDYRVYYVGGGLFILVVALSLAGVQVLKRKKVREAELRARELQQIPLEEKYLSELKQQIDLKSPNQVEALSAISRLFRKYLSEHFQIAALEITSNEIGEELKIRSVPELILQNTDEVLRSCDFAKFSGGQVEHGVLERVYTLVEDILKRNKSERLELTEPNEKG